MSTLDAPIMVDRGMVYPINHLPRTHLYINQKDTVIYVNNSTDKQLYIEQTNITNCPIPVATNNEKPLHELHGLVITPTVIGSSKYVNVPQFSTDFNNLSPDSLLSLLDSSLDESNFTQEYNNKIANIESNATNAYSGIYDILTILGNNSATLNGIIDDVDEHTININNNSNKIATIENNINDITNDLYNINNSLPEISNNTDAINAIKFNLNITKSGLNTVKANVTNLTYDVSANKRSINTLQTNVSSINNDIQNIHTINNQQNVTINNISFDVSNLQTSLNTISNRVDSNYDAIENIQSSIGSTDISLLRDNVSILDNKVSTNESSIHDIYSNYLNNWNTLQDTVNTNVNSITSLNTRLTTAEQDILDYGTSIFNIETTQEEHTTQLDTHSNTLINHDNRIANIEDRLDFDLFSFDKSEYGYVSNGDTIITQYEWSEQQPNIDVTLSQSVISVNGIDAEQELIFGIDGIKKSSSSDIYETTFNGAIVEYADPTNISLDWTSDTVTVSQPTNSENITTESDFTVTTADCMALNIKGKLAIKNTGSASFVSGILHLQAALDTPDGDDDVWFTIASLENLFKNNTSDWLEKNINVALVLNQASHKYKFRGKLISKYVPQNTCELSGYVYIDTVSESGTGTILSNKISAKYTIKE